MNNKHLIDIYQPHPLNMSYLTTVSNKQTKKTSDNYNYMKVFYNLEIDKRKYYIQNNYTKIRKNTIKWTINSSQREDPYNNDHKKYSIN